jgi:hypothetical protein
LKTQKKRKEKTFFFFFFSNFEKKMLSRIVRASSMLAVRQSSMHLVGRHGGSRLRWRMPTTTISASHDAHSSHLPKRSRVYSRRRTSFAAAAAAGDVVTVKVRG